MDIDNQNSTHRGSPTAREIDMSDALHERAARPEGYWQIIHNISSLLFVASCFCCCFVWFCFSKFHITLRGEDFEM